MSANGFEFTPENAAQAELVIARYPDGRQQSAVMPLLDLAQRQNGGWLPRAAIEYIADFLAMPRIRAQEVATFYTMYHLKPVGKHVVDVGETTEEGLFSLAEVECLGACCNAPMMQIGDAYYEDLDADSTRRVLEAFKRGEVPDPGSQTGRRSSEPATGLTTLIDGQMPGGG